MQIIIVGCGNVGGMLVRLLRAEGHSITVNTDGRPFVRCVAAALDPLMQHTDKHFSNPI